MNRRQRFWLLYAALRSRRVMPARKCLKCRDSYPADRGSSVRCPLCGEVLQYVSHGKPDTDWPPEIPEYLPDLSREVREEIRSAWESLQAEAQRRGERWSLADLIGEGDPRTLR